MIQRIQSLYLLLAAAAGIGTWFLNIWKATLNDGTTTYFNAQASFIVFVVLMLIVALALFSIFLYKNRKLQFRLTVLNVFLAIGAIALQYFQVLDFANDLQAKGKMISSSSYLPGAFLPILILIFLLLAARGIYKDEKLIKSLDRLR
jgi:predicted membrane channel-forming protein YqfA (hemolysin III family)